MNFVRGFCAKILKIKYLVVHHLETRKTNDLCNVLKINWQIRSSTCWMIYRKIVLRVAWWNCRQASLRAIRPGKFDEYLCASTRRLAKPRQSTDDICGELFKRRRTISRAARIPEDVQPCCIYGGVNRAQMTRKQIRDAFGRKAYLLSRQKKNVFTRLQSLTRVIFLAKNNDFALPLLPSNWWI